MEPAHEVKDDGGRLIREDFEKQILDYWRKPIDFSGFRTLPPPAPLTRRQRFRRWVTDKRYHLADRIGGDHYYTDGCGCDY